MKLASGLILLACFYALASAVEKEFSDVTITESIDDDPSRFANVLLDMLVKKPILDEASALRILATYKVEGVNRNAAAAEAFTKATISTLAAMGDADAARKFINHLTKLFDDADKQGLYLIEYLLELALDNDLVSANDAAKLAADEGYGVKIQTTRYSSSTQELESKPVSPSRSNKKECCAKFLTPLIGTRTRNDPYYIAYLADMTRMPKALHDPHNRYIDHIVATVAGSPDACDCDGSGTKLEPIFNSMTGGMRYINEAEANKLGSTKPSIYFYCAKTKGKCGATEPIRRYYLPGRQDFLTTSIEEGNKYVAQGWKDEGILCYGWPKVHMGPPNTFDWY